MVVLWPRMHDRLSSGLSWLRGLLRRKSPTPVPRTPPECANSTRRTAKANDLDAIAIDNPAARDGAQCYSEVAYGNIELGSESPRFAACQHDPHLAQNECGRVGSFARSVIDCPSPAAQPGVRRSETFGAGARMLHRPQSNRAGSYRGICPASVASPPIWRVYSATRSIHRRSAS
jgi:hypothetical protein